MNELRLRHSVRALIVDEVDRVLLCRIDAGGLVVWVTPGGGIEEGESHTVALRRELQEEVGFSLHVDPHHVWHQVLVAPHHAAGFDGVINDFYFVRTTAFEPRGTLTEEQLAAENLTESRWWTLEQIATYAGDAVFGPRTLAPMLSNLLQNDFPAEPLDIGI